MLTQQDAQHIAKQWIEDWNQHDLEAILSHYDEQIEFSSPIIVKLLNEPSGTIRGKAALRDYFTKGLAAYPDLHFVPIQILVGVNSLVIYYHAVNVRIGAEFMQFNAQGLVTRSIAHYDQAIA